MTVAQFLSLVVIALASHRVQRVVTRDSISASFRGWLWRKGYDSSGYNTYTEQMDVVVRSWWWSKVFELFDCPWCFGFHTSWAIYWVWTASPFPGSRTVVLVFAVAGLQGFIASRPNA